MIAIWFILAMSAPWGSIMSDQDQLPGLIAAASDASRLDHVQTIAAKRLLASEGEVYPADGCAITLSVLLQDAGIDVPDTFQALKLGNVLKERGWTVVALGSQQAGDIGSTCGPAPNHGEDHIYLVLKVLNADEMVIADNQAPQAHFRFASGKGGKTPTKFFLRAAT
jgi:hypothetical protein